MSMKIKRLEVEGYKSLKHIVWEPGDLNVLIGPNGSGKSNLLRLLELLSHSPREELKQFINSQERGISHILWDQIAESIKINMNSSLYDKSEKQEKYLDYTLVIDYIPDWNTYTVRHERLIMYENDHKAERMLVNNESGHCEYQDENRDIHSLNTESGTETSLNMLKRTRHSNHMIKSYHSNLSNTGFFYNPDTTFGSDIRHPSITRYEKKLHPNGRNLINYIHTLYSENKKFKNDLNEFMKAAFGPAYEELIFSPAADQYIQMRVEWKHLKWQQPAAVLSDGILKFLYLVAIFISPDPPNLIAIDEPSTGFHPSLFPIIAELADTASEQSQVVFTTHSPEFLNAIQEVNPNVVVTVMDWVEGETELKTLSGEKLEYWLKDYKLGEMFRSGGLEAI